MGEYRTLCSSVTSSQLLAGAVVGSRDIPECTPRSSAATSSPWFSLDANTTCPL